MSFVDLINTLSGDGIVGGMAGGITGLSLGFSLSYGENHKTKHRATMKRLASATASLREHTSALDSFLNDPDIPVKLKNFMLLVGDLIESREMTRMVSARLKATLKNGSQDAENEIWLEAKALSETYPLGFEQFIKTLFSGLNAALLRWPETADTFDTAVAPTQANIKREVVTAAQAVREQPIHFTPNGLAVA
jgi:hypothetical protein